MPIDYNKYPPTWKTQIRPAVMARAGNTCECDGCDFKHLEWVWSVKYKGRVTWYRDKAEAEKQPVSIERYKGVMIPNPKPVRVILTIAHLDHDELNHDVKLDRLKAMCQLCHLRYDAAEKYRRINNKPKASIEFGKITAIYITEPGLNLEISDVKIEQLIKDCRVVTLREGIPYPKENKPDIKIPLTYTPTITFTLK